MSGSACPDRMQTETFLLLQLDWPVLYLSKTSSWSVSNPHPLPVRSLFEKELLCNFKKTNKKNSVECKNVPTGIVSLFSKTFLTYLIWLAFQVTFHLRHWKHSLLALCSHMQAFTHVACLDCLVDAFCSVWQCSEPLDRLVWSLTPRLDCWVLGHVCLLTKSIFPQSASARHRRPLETISPSS